VFDATPRTPITFAEPELFVPVTAGVALELVNVPIAAQAAVGTRTIAKAIARTFHPPRKTAFMSSS
jgi:hypothetical protein